MKKFKFYGSLFGCLILAFVMSFMYLYVGLGDVNGSLVLKEEKYSIELGEKLDITVAELLQNPNNNIKRQAKIRIGDTSSQGNNNSIALDTENYAVGDYKGEIIYNDEKVDFILCVEDTTAPEFVDFEPKIIVEQSAEEVHLEKYYEIKDHSTAQMKIDDSQVKLDKVGKYDFDITAEDIYGNKTKEQGIVQVISFEEAQRLDLTAMKDGTVPMSMKMLAFIQQKEIEIFYAMQSSYFLQQNLLYVDMGQLVDNSNNSSQNGNGEDTTNDDQSTNTENTDSGSQGTNPNESGTSPSTDGNGSQTGGNNNSGSGNSGTGETAPNPTPNPPKPTPTPEPTPEPTPTPEEPKEDLGADKVGNTGVWHSTKNAARLYAEKQRWNVNSPWFSKWYDIWYVKEYGYTVNFKER